MRANADLTTSVICVLDHWEALARSHLPAGTLHSGPWSVDKVGLGLVDFLIMADHALLGGASRDVA